MLPYGTKVRISEKACIPNGINEGVIVGVINSGIPIFGLGYAVDVGRPVSESYPYHVVVVFEIHFEVI